MYKLTERALWLGSYPHVYPILSTGPREPKFKEKGLCVEPREKNASFPNP